MATVRNMGLNENHKFHQFLSSTSEIPGSEQVEMTGKRVKPNVAFRNHSETDDSRSSESITTQDEHRLIFQKARQLLSPTPFYRFMVYLYAERKLVVFFLIHFVATMVVWSHFGLTKFQLQQNTVPEAANRYWWKRLAPSLEFGSMHAILFQMALIPLTMSRLSIATLSESLLDKIVPMNRMLRMHIYLGYTMITIVFFATLFFFAFFGLLCSDGEQAFCDKFTAEIMLTGYSILSCLLIIGGTSYFRYVIPYELFYAIHHMVFVMYFITIAHTFDIEHRRGTSTRSQTFKWFSSTLLFYLCDRAAMHINNKHQAKVTAATNVTGSNGSKMIILKLRRPELFRFKPGQYSYLRIQQFDIHWHPFSIASDPDSSNLEFYVEVSDEKSWTGQLWMLLNHCNDQGQQDIMPDLSIEIMGPYGTSLAKVEDFTHVLAIGSGTGIVPLLSLCNQHIRQMLKLDPEVRLEELKERQDQTRRVALASESRKGSLFQSVIRSITDIATDGSPLPDTTIRHRLTTTITEGVALHDDLMHREEIRQNMVAMRHAAFRATLSIYGTVLLTLLPVFGVALLALTTSWNTIQIDLYDGMTDALKIMTVLFQTLYAGIAIFAWDEQNLLAYLDVALCAVTPFADLGWFRMYDKYGTLSDGDLTLFLMLHGYMTLRVWTKAVSSRHTSWKKQLNAHEATKLECLKVIWTTRSASQVSKILPDILLLWDSLVDAWGLENALRVCRISIYITDQDVNACKRFRHEVTDTTLFRCGAIQFGRANFPRLVEDHTLELIASGRSTSSSLLAYCGSPELASEIQYHKISNDMITAMMGHDKHQMTFVSESYGGSKT